MLKLLIIDDEVNTRRGIIGRLPLKEMGISDVYEADDGINGLKAVSAFNPDIILTDVRMPRMDGVEMVYKIRRQFSTCHVIFMSGYSDKEYLKSAIELKALNYIEKPINMNELKGALRTSISLCKEEKKKKELLKASLTLVRNELALQLINRNLDWESINESIIASRVEMPQDGIFVTILIRIHANTPTEQINSLKIRMENILENIKKTTQHSGIWAVKNDEYIIIHLFGNKNARHLFTSEKLENACHIILEDFSSSFPIFLSLGKTESGMQNLYSSYQSAVLGIQRAFYHGHNCIIQFCDIYKQPYSFTSLILKDFSELIRNEEQIKAEFLIKTLSSDIKRFDTTLVNECKDFYYRLLLELVKIASQYGFKFKEIPVLDTDIREKFLNFTTLQEMEGFLLRQLIIYLQYIADIKINDRAVINVIQYINSHYHEESLTISVISEHTHLSPAYLSSVFKKSTGKALVKYINDYRIEKAKEMLQNKKLKIADIASKVGCGDSNYFTKIFRKACGLTPSEFRERILQ